MLVRLAALRPVECELALYGTAALVEPFVDVEVEPTADSATSGGLETDGETGFGAAASYPPVVNARPPDESSMAHLALCYLLQDGGNSSSGRCKIHPPERVPPSSLQICHI